MSGRKKSVISKASSHTIKKFALIEEYYSKAANSYEGHKHFYNKYAAEVISFCQEHGTDYHIKDKTITEE